MINKICFKALVLSGGVFFLCGCSSIMSHSGGKEGLYSGTRANTQALGSPETSWALKPLVVLDLPFSAVMDTVFLPWDLYRKDNSLKSKVEASEKKNIAINSAIPPAKAL